MNMIEQTINIIITPGRQWEVIDKEHTPCAKVAADYLFWLALIPAVAIFIGQGLIGHNIPGVHIPGNVGLGIRQAIIQFISVLGGVYLTALVFNILAPCFGSRKSFDKSFSLAAYCYTPVCLGGVFYIHWGLAFLCGLISLYALYLLYIGIKPMMKTPDDKVTSYFLAALLVMIAVSVGLSIMLRGILGIHRGIF